MGAWWIGFLISGVLAFLVALPIAGFPSSLPGSEKFKAEREQEVYSKKDKKAESKYEDMSGGGTKCEGEESEMNYKQILKSVKVLVMNPTFMFLNLAAACEGRYPRVKHTHFSYCTRLS